MDRRPTDARAQAVRVRAGVHGRLDGGRDGTAGAPRAGAALSGSAAQVLTAVADPRRSGVLVVGESGSGKSFVLRQVHARLSAGAAGTGTLVRPPAVDESAFCSLLRGAATEPGSGPRTERHQRGGAVVAVDDVHLLSPSALASLAEALDRRTVQLAGTVPAAHAPQVLDLLRPLQPLGVVELAPWRARDLAAYAARRLRGGHLHEESLHRLLRFSGGNARVLTELVDHGLEVGRLRCEHGTWVWDGQLQAPPLTRVRLGRELARLDPDVRDVLHAAVLVEGVEVDDLAAAFGVSAVERAEESGVLHVAPVGTRLDTAVRPAYADVIRTQMVQVRRRRLARSLAATVTATAAHAAPAQGPDAVRAVLLSQLAGRPVDASLVLPAARCALHRHDPELAEHLLAGAGCDAESAELRAAALVELGRYDRAADALAPDGAVPPDAPGGSRLAAHRAAILALRAGARPPAAPPTAPCDDGARADAHRLLVDVWFGDRLVPLAQDRAPVHDGLVLLAGAGACAQLARLDAACALLAGTGTAGGTTPLPRAAGPAVRALCELARGAVGVAETLGEDLRRTGIDEGWPLAYQLGAVVVGRCALDRGDVARATVHLGEASVGRPDVDTVLRGYALAHLALAHAAAGRTVEAEAALREARRTERDVVPHALVDLARLAGAESLHVRGLHGAALEAAAAVARDAQHHGHTLVHLRALHLCARVAPSAHVAESTAAVAARADFALAEVYARHARAAADGDGAALGQVALDYEERGLHWLAAETAAAAVRAGGGAGTTAARRCRVVLDRLGHALPAGLPGWWLRPEDHADPLTEREREVAELVAAGRTSPQVAALLQVSPRTVENHLQHCYRKLGIADRGQLAEALGRAAQRR
ncbi:AAA domain-containing protein [Cellulomonas sp. JZ18]|uniref:LuxR C-terminal-related transcriptional regulator n=1 Tax=Cellulomonas sp. JZ18 TaxID=2654191 RepID=UPI0012D4878B|nr:LuxR C-terminal-related transcriptional regulator [Cellulomonas sp. JZ18]QGQ19281.1 AAA domain-containing protein [Cellulomonas sp. JZ18]